MRRILKAVPLIFLAALLNAQTAVFPDGIVTDAQLKVAANGITTLLTGAATNSQTTLTVSACNGITANYLISVDSEIMSVNSCSGTSMVIGSRGFDGTPPAAHLANTMISVFIDAWHHNAMKAEVEAVESSWLGGTPSTMGLVNSITTGSINTITNLSQFNYQNFPLTSQDQGNQRSTIQAGVGAIVTPPTAVTMNKGGFRAGVMGLSGYALCERTDVDCIGVYGWAMANTASPTQIWGANFGATNATGPLASDGSGTALLTMMGLELDLNVFKDNSNNLPNNVWGLYVTGAAQSGCVTSGGICDAIIVNPVGEFASPVVPWNIALESRIGAASVGVRLWPALAGNSHDSQLISLIGIDGSGAQHNSGIFGNSIGALVFDAANGNIDLGSETGLLLNSAAPFTVFGGTGANSTTFNGTWQLGAVAAGPSQNSNIISFSSEDSGSVAHFSSVWGDENGGLRLVGSDGNVDMSVDTGLILNSSSVFTIFTEASKLAISGLGMISSGTQALCLNTGTGVISYGCGSGSGFTPYSATVTSQTTLSVPASTHGLGTKVIASCFDNSSPAVATSCNYTVDGSGNVIFSWSPTFTGSITII